MCVITCLVTWFDWSIFGSNAGYGNINATEKSQIKECIKNPYCKPTLVDWSSRLRHSSKYSSRNSAIKLSVTDGRCSVPRNNGITTKDFHLTV